MSGDPGLIFYTSFSDDPEVLPPGGLCISDPIDMVEDVEGLRQHLFEFIGIMQGGHHAMSGLSIRLCDATIHVQVLLFCGGKQSIEGLTVGGEQEYSARPE